MSNQINGIQQIGIGTPDLERTWKWLRCRFGMDIPIFREAAEAPLMTRYTGGQVESRDAVLAINLQGGAGFEIWQYTSRETSFPKVAIELGDTGIFATIIKTDDINKTYTYLYNSGCNIFCAPKSDPDGNQTFFLSDPWGNIFKVVKSTEWFDKKQHLTGGPIGALIGVSNMEQSLALYHEMLGFDIIQYDREGRFADLYGLNKGDTRFRRVLLKRSANPGGPFAPLFGPCQIELIQTLERKPRKIFDKRLWGDAGFIHLCFDVTDMDSLGKILAKKGFAFTVDSGTSFDMGEAAGRFAYIEDPDGTLIEFVETFKIPVMKKINWNIDLSKRKTHKPLPRLLLKALGLNRVKGNCD